MTSRLDYQGAANRIEISCLSNRNEEGVCCGIEAAFLEYEQTIGVWVRGWTGAFMKKNNQLPPQIPAEIIERKIYLIRNRRVMVDSDLAFLYGVSTSQLIQAVKRNAERFPSDFMFELSLEEWKHFQHRFAIRKVEKGEQLQRDTNLRSQFVISSSQGTEDDEFSSANGYGGRRSIPYCFTEQGVTMLSAVLKSSRAIAVSIEVVRSFVRLREILSSNLELARRLSHLEEKYDEQFKVIFDTIRELMAAPESKKKGRIGF